MLASRGLAKKTLTSSGALAVLQIGFLMTLANIRKGEQEKEKEN
jgi:hypothetical protein